MSSISSVPSKLPNLRSKIVLLLAKVDLAAVSLSTALKLEPLPVVLEFSYTIPFQNLLTSHSSQSQGMDNIEQIADVSQN